MNDSENSLGRSIKMILGTLGIFVVFGFLALILSGFAGNESAEERAFKGEFSEETTKARWANLEEVQEAQAGAFDSTKVDEALKKIGSTAAKPSKTEVVVPGSPTFLKQSGQPQSGQPDSAPAETEEAKPEGEKAKPEGDSPAIEPKAPGAAAPEKEVPAPGPVNAPEEKAKPKNEGNSKGEAKPKDDAKAEAPAKPESAPANQ